MSRLQNRATLEGRKACCKTSPLTPEQLERKKKAKQQQRIIAGIKREAELDKKIAAYILRAPEVNQDLFSAAMRDVYHSWHLPRIPQLAPQCFVSGTRSGSYEKVWIVPPQHVIEQMSTTA